MLIVARTLGVLIVVLALATSAPEVCRCAPGQQMGAVLHSLFLHHHSPDPVPLRAEVADAERMTSVTAATGPAVGSFAMSGGAQGSLRVFPLLWSGPRSGIGLVNLAVPMSAPRGPESPPPRQAP